MAFNLIEFNQFKHQKKVSAIKWDKIIEKIIVEKKQKKKHFENALSYKTLDHVKKYTKQETE